MPTAPALQNPDWPRLADPALPPGLKLWRVDLDRSPAPLDLLAQDETDRAARFHSPCHRRRFAAGRAALRILLGRELDRPPETIRFRYSEFGKPSTGGPHFNVAHSGAIALIAISPHPVGVDLELIRPVEFETLARSVFSPSELALWRTLHPEQKPAAFYSLWTRKEALLKALGCGIASHLRHVSAYFDNAAHLEIPASLDPRPWSVISLPLGIDHCAAAAIQG